MVDTVSERVNRMSRFAKRSTSTICSHRPMIFDGDRREMVLVFKSALSELLTVRWVPRMWSADWAGASRSLPVILLHVDLNTDSLQITSLLYFFLICFSVLLYFYVMFESYITCGLCHKMTKYDHLFEIKTSEVIRWWCWTNPMNNLIAFLIWTELMIWIEYIYT